MAWHCVCGNTSVYRLCERCGRPFTTGLGAGAPPPPPPRSVQSKREDTERVVRYILLAPVVAVLALVAPWALFAGLLGWAVIHCLMRITAAVERGANPQSRPGRPRG